MVFELSDSLIDDILFSMEDQNCKRMVSAKNCIVVPQDSLLWDSELKDKLPENACVDDDNFYELPVWSSGDGYELLDSFTEGLHSPFARAELKNVLVSGRGVFRNFKDVLKSYPEVERKFHFYKDSKMKMRVIEWYNGLRESWGLEKLDALNTDDVEEVDELVQNDFVFSQYDSVKDRNDVESTAGFLAEEYKKQFAGEIGDAVAEMVNRLSSFSSSEDKYGFVCHNLDEEFTGCVLVSSCPSYSKRTVTLTDFFVLQNYRGLGIGKELFSRCLAGLRSCGVQWILIANTIIPKTMVPLLNQYGFEKIGSGFVADLCKGEW